MKRRPDDSIGGQYDLPFDEAKTGASKFPVKNTDYKEIANANKKSPPQSSGVLKISP